MDRHVAGLVLVVITGRDDDDRLVAVDVDLDTIGQVDDGLTAEIEVEVGRQVNARVVAEVKIDALRQPNDAVINVEIDPSRKTDDAALFASDVEAARDVDDRRVVLEVDVDTRRELDDRRVLVLAERDVDDRRVAVEVEVDVLRQADTNAVAEVDVEFPALRSQRIPVGNDEPEIEIETGRQQDVAGLGIDVEDDALREHNGAVLVVFDARGQVDHRWLAVAVVAVDVDLETRRQLDHRAVALVLALGNDHLARFEVEVDARRQIDGHPFARQQIAKDVGDGRAVLQEVERDAVDQSDRPLIE